MTWSWTDETKNVGLESVLLIPNACRAFAPTPFTSSTVHAVVVFGLVAQLSVRVVGVVPEGLCVVALK